MNPTQNVELPHDILGLLPVPWPWWVIPLVLASIGLLAALVWYVRAIIKGKKTTGVPLAHDPWAALLGRLLAMNIPAEFEPGKVQEDHFFALSILLREAIEMRTGIPATDMTYQELKEPLRKRLPLTPQETEAVLAFLERADLIKFASVPSDRSEAEEFRSLLATWMASLKPKSIDQNPWEKGALPAESSDAHGVRA